MSKTPDKLDQNPEFRTGEESKDVQLGDAAVLDSEVAKRDEEQYPGLDFQDEIAPETEPQRMTTRKRNIIVNPAPSKK